jgi:hypothetical protein
MALVTVTVTNHLDAVDAMAARDFATMSARIISG